MADVAISRVTETRVLYTLALPTNWAEVSKVLAIIRQELRPDSAQWDDTVTVAATEEELVFSHADQEYVNG